MKEYETEDFEAVVVPACVEAIDWGGGALSYVKQALLDSGILIPNKFKLDTIVFAGMEKAERLIKSQGKG